MSGGLRPRTAETLLPGPSYYPSPTTLGQYGRRLLYGPVRRTRALLSQMSGEQRFTLGSSLQCIILTVVTVGNSGCGKVMFSQAGEGRAWWRVGCMHGKGRRASSSYFFLFFPIFLSKLLFFLFFINFLLFFLFFSHFTYNKQIFVRDLNILSLFKYVVYRVH